MRFLNANFCTGQTHSEIKFVMKTVQRQVLVAEANVRSYTYDAPSVRCRGKC